MDKEKEFYSNCLLEALKAKIRDPVNIKIRYLPMELNETPIPHFMWQDENYTYDFHTKGKLTFFQQFYHKGNIRKKDLNYYDRALEIMKRKAVSKKYK